MGAEEADAAFGYLGEFEEGDHLEAGCMLVVEDWLVLRWERTLHCLSSVSHARVCTGRVIHTRQDIVRP